MRQAAVGRNISGLESALRQNDKTLIEKILKNKNKRQISACCPPPPKKGHVDYPFTNSKASAKWMENSRNYKGPVIISQDQKYC